MPTHENPTHNRAGPVELSLTAAGGYGNRDTASIPPLWKKLYLSQFLWHEPLKSYAEAGVGKKAGGVVAESPAKANADFKILGQQVVRAWAEERARFFVG